MMNKNSKIYIAGHTGLLGSAFLSVLKKEGYKNIIIKTHDELELKNREELDSFFSQNSIEYVFLCAGKVGGIIGNKKEPATFFHENIVIQDNIFEMAVKYNVKNVVFYGSSCTYPKSCKQPMAESDWLTGPIEETSMGYAAAKIAGIIACKSYNIQYNTNRFICVVPNSMYGPNDNFDLENSHVFSALIRKIDDAKTNNQKSLTLWGSGNPRREFIYSEDVVKASIFLVKNVDKLENNHYNLGTSEDFSIKELANLICEVVGYSGEIKWDLSKPDGVERKLLDSTKFLDLGFKIDANFQDRLKQTYKWYLEQKGNIR